MASINSGKGDRRMFLFQVPGLTVGMEMPPIAGKVVRRWKAPLAIFVLCALALALPRATADTCPAGAVSTGLGLVLTAFRTNTTTHALEPIDFRGVGACEPIFLQGTLVYVPRDSQGNIVSAFEGGTVRVRTTTFNRDVTPVGGVPKIGPQPSTCSPPAVTDTEPTQVAPYIVNPADIVGGKIMFFIQYTNGTAHIGNDIAGVESATTAITITVTPLPTCAVTPPSQTVCEGATATFSAKSTGSAAGAPFTISWSGPNGHTALCTGLTINDSCAITVNSAVAADAGTYTATITDRFGCTSTCTGTLAVTPAPTCSIAGDNPVCAGSTHTYTSTVLPAGGTVTHSWSITGNGTINGSTTGTSVSVTAGAAGAFKLTDSITQNGCPGQCSLTVTGNPCKARICVAKEIACVLQGGSCGSFGPTATGVKSASVCPAFCYRITVSNCGDVDLVNVTVVDDKLNLGGCGFPTSLAKGQSFTCDTLKATWCVDTVNTVSANGVNAVTGEHAPEATASATAFIRQPAVACVKLASSPDDGDGDPNGSDVALPGDGADHTVNYSVQVNNSGTTDLIVTVDDPALAEAGWVMPAPFSLPAGHSTVVPLCSAVFNLGSRGGANDCANPLLGAAAGCTVLELDGGHVDMTGPPGCVDGDVCVGPNGR